MATLETVATWKKKIEPTAEGAAALEPVRIAKEQGPSLTGPVRLAGTVDGNRDSPNCSASRVRPSAARTRTDAKRSSPRARRTATRNDSLKPARADPFADTHANTRARSLRRTEAGAAGAGHDFRARLGVQFGERVGDIVANGLL